MERYGDRWTDAGNLIGDAIGHITKREVRVTVLGHIQRGGSPSPFDRILSTRFGVAAVDLISTGDFGRMVCLINSSVEEGIKFDCADCHPVEDEYSKLAPEADLEFRKLLFLARPE